MFDVLFIGVVDANDGVRPTITLEAAGHRGLYLHDVWLGLGCDDGEGRLVAVFLDLARPVPLRSGLRWSSSSLMLLALWAAAILKYFRAWATPSISAFSKASKLDYGRICVLLANSMASAYSTSS